MQAIVHEKLNSHLMGPDNLIFFALLMFLSLQQGAKRMPGTAVTKSVVANEPGGRKREEIFVDIIEKISVTFSSSVSYFT